MIKTEAIGTKYGWIEALTNNYQHEGNQAPADAEIMPNDKAMAYLVLSAQIRHLRPLHRRARTAIRVICGKHFARSLRLMTMRT
jgi:hypothetical protein